MACKNSGCCFCQLNSDRAEMPILRPPPRRSGHQPWLVWAFLQRALPLSLMPPSFVHSVYLTQKTGSCTNLRDRRRVQAYSICVRVLRTWFRVGGLGQCPSLRFHLNAPRHHGVDVPPIIFPTPSAPTFGTDAAARPSAPRQLAVRFRRPSFLQSSLG